MAFSILVFKNLSSNDGSLSKTSLAEGEIVVVLEPDAGGWTGVKSLTGAGTFFFYLILKMYIVFSLFSLLAHI